MTTNLEELKELKQRLLNGGILRIDQSNNRASKSGHRISLIYEKLVRQDGKWEYSILHTDTLDPYNAKQRERFIKQCLQVNPGESEEDLHEQFMFILRHLQQQRDGVVDGTVSELGGESPLTGSPAPPDLAQTHYALKDIVSSPYCGDALELSLAVALNIKRVKEGKDNGLVWLLIVGAPSSGKTETVLGLKYTKPHVNFKSSLTEHSFTTGYVNHRSGKPAKSLLPELDGRTLLIKDLTSLFGIKSEKLTTILADMCDIYDGSYSRFTGTVGSIDSDARFSFVGCITPKVLHEHSHYIDKIGSRFLRFDIPQLSPVERKAGFRRARDKNRQIKIALYQQRASGCLLNLLSRPTAEIELTAEQDKRIETMSEFISRARGQDENPYRVYQQLIALAIDLSLVHLRSRVTEHEMELLRRVALSTIPPKRLQILLLFRNPENLTSNGDEEPFLTAESVMDSLGGTEQWRLKELKQLEQLGLLTADTSRKPHRFRLVSEFVDLVLPPVEPLDHAMDLLGPPSVGKEGEATGGDKIETKLPHTLKRKNKRRNNPWRYWLKLIRHKSDLFFWACSRQNRELPWGKFSFEPVG